MRNPVLADGSASANPSREVRSLREQLSRVALPALLILLTVAVYLPSLSGQFLWDDNMMIRSNPAMSQPGGLHRIWTGTGGPDFYPLTLTLLWAEWQGWQRNTFGYHAVTVGLHAVGVLLLWLLLKRLGVPGAWWGAALFAVHPVNVETVAWIAETKNTLSMVFYLAALLAYLRYEDRPRWAGYAAALVLFALALLSKTSVVMLPCVLLLFAWWRRREISRTDLLRSIPFFLLSAGMGATTLLVQKYQTTNAVSPGLAVSFWERCLGAGTIFWFYVGKAIFPHPLLTVYAAFPSLGIVPDVALGAVLVVLWLNRRIAWVAAILFAAAYFLLSLVPVLGFIDSSYSTYYSSVADHYQYLALAGITALVGAGIALLPRPAFPLGLACALVLAGVLSAASILQEQAYQSQDALFSNLLRDAPYAPRSYTLMGTALLDEGRAPEALELLESAVAVDPSDGFAHYNLCAALVLAHRAGEAEQQCRLALAINPNVAEVWIDLGVALGAQSREGESVEALERAVRLAPQNPTAQLDLGLVLKKIGRLSEAADHFREALRTQPDMKKAREELNTTLIQLGR